MRIESLIEFIALAETLNYRSASLSLFLSPSTLSKHISDLEQEMGIKLFERSTRHVALTAEGRKTYRNACEVVDAYRRMIDIFPAKSTSELRIAAPLDYTHYRDCLQSAVERLAALHPDCKIFVHDYGIACDEFVLLREGFDAVLTGFYGDRNHGYTASEWLFDMKCSVWVPSSSPLVAQASVSLSELKKYIYRLAEPSADSPWTSLLLGKLEQAGFTPILGSPVDDTYRLGIDDYAIVGGGGPDRFRFGGEIVQLPLEEDIVMPAAAVYDIRNTSEELHGFLRFCREWGAGEVL